MRLLRRLYRLYQPDEAAYDAAADAQTQERNGLTVRVAVPDPATAGRVFGVPVARRGVLPVWVSVRNDTAQPVRLQCVALDPDYFSPLEAAAVCHFSGLRRLLGYGLLAWLFLPVLGFLVFRLIVVRFANRKMDDVFRRLAFRLRPVPPGGEQAGYVYAHRTEGTRVLLIRLLTPSGPTDFEFTVQCRSLRADHLRRGVGDAPPDDPGPDLDAAAARAYLEGLPAATSDRRGRRTGDPVNLVLVGEFDTVLSVFSSGWDETEVISLASCWRTVRAFLTGAEYRYSPVSGLYLLGRTQDVALQRVRRTIHERLHLRLWRVPVRFRGRPVWVGQVSRDIGVRLTHRTWNLMTHRIDPDVDESRDYVVEHLMHLGRAEVAVYVGGVGACPADAPRRNLTGDPYHTDGQRAAVVLSDARTAPAFAAVLDPPPAAPPGLH